MRNLLLAAAIAMMLVPANAQAGNTGSVRGYIRSWFNDAPERAVVTLESNTASRRTVTDPDGFFLIWDLPPGLYTMTVYGGVPRQRPVCVHADEDQYANFRVLPHVPGVRPYAHYLDPVSLGPDASQTTDLYSLGACN